jgi:hypothetical protein
VLQHARSVVREGVVCKDLVRQLEFELWCVIESPKPSCAIVSRQGPLLLNHQQSVTDMRLQSGSTAACRICCKPAQAV